MKLYEIDAEIMTCFDPETGEVIDPEKLESLAMDREHKIENILLWKKDLDAEAAAIAAEIKNLTDRKRAAENKSESLKSYIKFILAGEKFKTARVSVSYRKVPAVAEFADEGDFIAWAMTNNRDDLLAFQAPKISKTAVKDALTNGEEIPGVHLEEKTAIIIK